VLAFNVTEPGEQKVVEPAAVITAAGITSASTLMLFEIVLPHELMTIQSYVPVAVAEYVAVVAPVMFVVFWRHW
jgi:hypothetical protein